MGRWHGLWSLTAWLPGLAAFPPILQPVAGCLTFLNLSFFLCKAGVILARTSVGYFEYIKCFAHG